MDITSIAFINGEKIPIKYSCDGDGINPPLTLNDVPENTVTLALIVEDPDASRVVGHVWDHWVVFNISPQTTEIVEGVSPSGVAGSNTQGENMYQPMCPPNEPGEIHHYVFTVYALDATLNTPEGATKKQVLAEMEGHVLAKAELIGIYERV